MATCMNYSKANEWIIGEDRFDSKFLGKCESIMCLGNGYMGMRSATEEHYLGEVRDIFIAGTFNKFDENEVTELPNGADVTAFDIEINGEFFQLEKGTIKDYNRELNLKSGELSRRIIWVSSKGDEIAIDFYRMISMDQLHTIAQKITITPINNKVSLKVVTGINGQMTNSGAQHFSEGDKRLYEQKYMQYVQTTTQSKIDFVWNTAVTFTSNEELYHMNSRIIMDRRKIFSEYTGDIDAGTTLVIEKISNVYTNRDKGSESLEIKELQQLSLEEIRKVSKKGYDLLLNESKKAWEEKVWNQTPITIDSPSPMDQLAIHFAQYHLYVMTPAHDNRMNIGAKGLSGEGYKGHTFWDTDIFALPYFTFTDPTVARSLEEYRYLSLGGAHGKAKSNNYEGAQFPWESAWLHDGEVTPVWGAADIITGLPTKIMSGFIEQHITSDVAYGVWQYYQVTNDQDYMDRYGYELILDTAKFWCSRLEWSEGDNKYHINDVVGPDEYKEGVDDNAFTNYMAYWNIEKAIEYHDFLKENKPELYTELEKKLDLARVYKQWLDKKDQIFLPLPREDKIIAQDATYLTLKDIDLTKYKNQENVGSMFLDYSLEQVQQIQVSKQADIMILFFLLEDLFPLDVKKANWDYYEARTLHDSSLSLSTHCILANDMGNRDLAYELFQRACGIDMGDNMKTSDAGVHAASLAGIWQSTVFGFGGVRMLNGNLRINPALPNTWNKLSFTIYWHGQKLLVEVEKESIFIQNLTNTAEVTLSIFDKAYTINKELKINL